MKLPVITLCIVLLLLFFQCTKKSDQFTYNFDGYKKWKQPVKGILDYTVPGHGKSFRRIYANAKSYNARIITDDNKVNRVEYRNGSIIVKEVFKKRSDIDKNDPELTIMVKDQTNPTAIQGWVYFVKHPNDTHFIQITGNMCSSCHEAANDSFNYFDGNKEDIFRDYIFVPVYKIK